MAARAIVVGGGISGLATAFRLLERPGLEVMVYEADTRVGGTIGTIARDGYRVETGPNGFLDSRHETLELVEELGLTEQLVPANPQAKRRYTVRRGRIEPLPGNPLAFLRSPVLSRRGRLRVMVEGLVRRPATGPDETVFDFGVRRVGREFAERLIDPMVRGVFAGDPHQLSLRSAFPRMAALEAEHGTLTRALLRLMRQARRRRKAGATGSAAKRPDPGGFGGTLTSFEGGMQRLSDRLAERLGERVATGHRLAALARDGDGWRLSFRVGNGSKTEVEADFVVLALPAYVTAELVAPLSAPLAAELGDIPYAPVAVVALGFPRAVVAHDLAGFGFVTAAVESPSILGTLFSSSIFAGRAPADHVLLRSMVGGIRDPAQVDLDDDALVDLVTLELEPLVGLSGPPTFREVIRWPRGIPQYHVGHAARLERIDRALEEVPGLFLTGNAYRGVAINDCIREAGAVATALGVTADRRP